MSRPIRLSLFVFAVFLAGVPSLILAGDDVTCKDGARGKWEDVKKLHPTQFSVGMQEVDEIAERPKHQIEKDLLSDPPKVVIGPAGHFVFDGHHHGLAAMKAGFDSIPICIYEGEKWKDLSDEDFWKKMSESHRVYPYDKDGRGPLDPRRFDTMRLTDLEDDPFRTLAEAVRKNGGYQKREDVPFAEFTWADYFRHADFFEAHRPPWDKDAFRKAVEEGAQLAHRPEAKDLPGYISGGNAG